MHGNSNIKVITASNNFNWLILFIYLLTAIGLSPGGSSTIHIYTQTIHRTTQNKQYTEQPTGSMFTARYELNIYVSTIYISRSLQTVKIQTLPEKKN